MDPTPFTRSPRLKIERAYNHINELRRLSEPLSETLYEIVMREIRPTVLHNNPTAYELSYRPKKPIAETFALIIGDAFHNIRTAFDHMACHILREANTWTTRSGFPFHEARQNLVGDRNFLAIQEAIPNVGDVILNEIRPYSDGEQLLWMASKADRLDKHNMFVPTVAVTNVRNVNMIVGGSIFENASVENDADYPFIFARSYMPITNDGEFRTSVAIRFSEAADFFQNQPVIATLTQIAKLADDAVSMVETAIRQSNSINRHASAERQNDAGLSSSS
jgi:hypothetical protein